VTTSPLVALDRRLLDPTLFTTVDSDGASSLRLAGSRCSSCGAVTFPAQASCPRCTGQDVTIHALAEHGTVWASTVQRFTPKPPYLGAGGGPAPYAVGYVDLAREVLVESRLVGPFQYFQIGAAVTLTLEELPGADGEPVWTFAFKPADTAASPGADLR
jgi:uncharacterized OB-fold protein